MNFGEALHELKAGGNVARSVWEDKFIFLVRSTSLANQEPLMNGVYYKQKEIHVHVRIDMEVSGNQIIPWLASQTDVLAEDWLDVGNR